jgi:protein-tyrosine phosphatase
MPVIDFHSHILPGIDDGSRNIEESLAMLHLAGRQDVDLMVSTSHFYARHDRPEKFLRRRNDAFKRLKNALEISRREEKLNGDYHRKVPEIILGAEVAYFDGISQAEDIKQLTIEGTNLLLLEMPFGKWSESVIEDVEDLVYNTDMKIILAHLERFFMFPVNKKKIFELIELPLYVQVNAESLLHWRTRGKTVKLLDRKGIGLLGSDCHRIDQRTPNLPEGRAVIRKMLGDLFFERMDELGSELLQPSIVDFDKA